ncbi:PD-(D/E)XK nuclease family transposase [Paenibacillus sp. GCM10027626]|uniref:PD-(D/E)XK nuclease family transposase n=1 Tax=Paenibacillus sp. GCM10027626 TaxID=3273411 RepID=UPI003644CBEC
MPHEVNRTSAIPPYIDLRAEFAFRSLFGQLDCEKVLVGFLNALLGSGGRDMDKADRSGAITKVIMLNSDMGQPSMHEPGPLLEVMAETEDGKFVQIELLLAFDPDLARRRLHNWSFRYTTQILRGQLGSGLKRTVPILITFADLLPSMRRYHSTFGFYDRSVQDAMPDQVEIHVFELAKLLKRAAAGELERWLEPECRWLLLLGVVQGGAVQTDLLQQLRENAVSREDELLDAFERWEDLSRDPQMWEQYERWHEAMMENAVYKAEVESVRRAQAASMPETESGLITATLQNAEQWQAENKLLKERLLATGHKLLASGVMLDEVVELTGIPAERLSR